MYETNLKEKKHTDNKVVSNQMLNLTNSHFVSSGKMKASLSSKLNFHWMPLNQLGGCFTKFATCKHTICNTRSVPPLIFACFTNQHAGVLFVCFSTINTQYRWI